MVIRFIGALVCVACAFGCFSSSFDMWLGRELDKALGVEDKPTPPAGKLFSVDEE